MADAIYTMVVRGAPAIGASAGFGMALLSMTFSFPATANPYEPGTMGYLYADCAAALEKSASPAEFLNT